MVANCELVWKEISNYLEGEVEAGLRAAMDEHFRTCQRCRSVLEGTCNVTRLYGDERMTDVPAGFSSRLEHRLSRSSRVRIRQWPTWSAWLVPLAALLLIAGGVRIASSLTATHPLLSEHANPGHGIPDDMVVIVSTGAKDFHVAGCPFIHNKDQERTLSAKEAMREGYVPCVRCMRKYLHTADLGKTSLELGADGYIEPEAGELASERTSP